jgi:serine/arginine repetitive matrix protein 2
MGEQMLGGGHVRRRSVDSCIDGSPCVNLEKKKHTALQHLARVLQFDQGVDELPASVPDRFSKISPDKAVLPKPSIASTSSYQFGAERMIMAGKGLLARQSLEDSALMAHGEDIIASCKLPSQRCRNATDIDDCSGNHQSVLSSRPCWPLALKHGDQLWCRNASSIGFRQLVHLQRLSV